MNPDDEQFGERNFCYMKRDNWLKGCKECQGYNKQCDNYESPNYKREIKHATLVDRIEQYKKDGIFDNIEIPAYKFSNSEVIIKNEPNQLELELEYK